MWTSITKSLKPSLIKTSQRPFYITIEDTLHRVKTRDYKAEKLPKHKPTYKSVRLKFGYEAR